MARTSKKILTRKQQDVLDYIIKYKREHSNCPTYRNICENFNYASPATAYQIVKSLIIKGYLYKNNHGVLNIYDDVTPQQDVSINYRNIPIISMIEEGKDIIRDCVIEDHLPLMDGFSYKADLFYYKATREDEELNIKIGDYLLCSIESSDRKQNGYKIIGNNMYYIAADRIGYFPIDGYILAIIRFLK